MNMWRDMAPELSLGRMFSTHDSRFPIHILHV